jgi:hypothetical protein
MGSVCGARFALDASLLFLMAILFGSPAHAQIDPSGEWSPRFHEDQPERIPGPEIGDYLGLPINAAARLRGDSWDATLLEIPENQCRAHGADYAWRGPSNIRIWKEVDLATQQLVAYHIYTSAYNESRTIWMDGRPHPPAYARHTWLGFSTGTWEGGILTVTTDHLKENWVRRNGIARSDRAVVTEHFLRHGDYLTMAVITYDPVYLTEPFIRTTDFVEDHSQQIAPWPCEAVDEVDRPEGVIPNHLPGTNTFLDEFPAKYGIPPEAARGGAQTMYPEYAIKMKQMKKLPRPTTKATKASN